MPTDPNRVKEIFLEAVELTEEAARIAYLDRACAGDAELRARVEALLRSHDEAGSFLGESAFASPRPSRFETTERGSTGANAGPESTREDDEPDALSFLAPSGRPEALGRIGHYEVLEVLGKGGFGVVLRAFDEKLHRMVAIKVPSEQIASTSPARKRFLREARSSAKVRHENVVQIYSVEEQSPPYLVMEYIPGETLQQRLDRTGPLETAEVLLIGRQIAEALAAAHAQGLVHRDVKPANILIENSPSPHVKITDFGLARAADDVGATQSGAIAGTPMYMAPEQARGQSLDHRADLFSLGSVLYAMCTGRPPFRASGTVAVLKRVVEDTPPPIREIVPDVPQWLCDVVSRLHAKNPDDRISSAREAADLLAQGLASTQASANVPAAPASAAPVRRRKRGRALAETLELAELAPRRRFARRVGVAAVLLLILGGFGFAEATGVTDVRGTVVRLFSPEGTLVVEVDDPGVSLKIDDSDIVIKGAGVKEIRLKPGNYRVEARRDGRLVRQELVEVTRNGKRVVKISREPPQAVANRAGPVENVDAWERSVAELSAHEQIQAVTERLKERNPGFDGKLDYDVEEGVVRGLTLSSAAVKDLSPLHALAGLKRLHVGMWGKGAGRGALADLSPLRGLALEELDCAKTEVSDLSPLRGMPLTRLKAMACPVSSLAPLAGMPLAFLDLAFVRGRVTDLEPLRGMPLEYLNLTDLPASDLAPLKNIRTLRHLVLDGAHVSDLTPLANLRLVQVSISGAGVTDLAPLGGMDLEEIRLEPKRIEKGWDIVLDRKSLKRVKTEDDREWSPGEFRARYERGEFTGGIPKKIKAATDAAEWERSVAALPAAEQVAAVAARMKELNPGFDGRILPLFDRDAVTGLEFNSDDVSDITPLRALTRLASLKCSGTEPRNGRISDLSPLRGLRLTSLDVSQNRVSDLSPIEGMPLTDFWCGETLVIDLSPLKGMQLRYLNCVKTDVHDLTPLRGMPLEVLHLHKTKVVRLTGLEGTQLRDLMMDMTKVFDLSPLKGLPLVMLDLSSTPVSDLSPLKGMKLRALNCGSTFVSDLSPLAGMPLRYLVCTASRVDDRGLVGVEKCEDVMELALSHTRVSDAGLARLKGLKKLKLLDMMDIEATELTALKNLSLERIRLTPRRLSLKGLKLLRDMDVKTIGTDWNEAYPAREFWARFDKGEFR